MLPEGDRRRLGVLGWPVAHSRSPAMQNAALIAVGLERWRYQLLLVVPTLLAEFGRDGGGDPGLVLATLETVWLRVLAPIGPEPER